MTQLSEMSYLELLQIENQYTNQWNSIINHYQVI